MGVLELPKQAAIFENPSEARTVPVEIRSSPSRGLGLFATRDIAEGSEVMSCVAKDLTEVSPEIPFAMAQYLFAHPDHFSDAVRDRRYLMVCGEMVFLNHCDEANCVVSWVTRNHGLLYAHLRAKVTVREGEELTIRYTDSSDYQAHGYF